MAALRIACPSCKTVLQVGEPSFGKAVRCPKCQTVMKVPASAASGKIRFGSWTWTT